MVMFSLHHHFTKLTWCRLNQDLIHHLHHNLDSSISKLISFFRDRDLKIRRHYADSAPKQTWDVYFLAQYNYGRVYCKRQFLCYLSTGHDMNCHNYYSV